MQKSQDPFVANNRIEKIENVSKLKETELSVFGIKQYLPDRKFGVDVRWDLWKNMPKKTEKKCV